jgi:hypothetical protein
MVRHVASFELLIDAIVGFIPMCCNFFFHRSTYMQNIFSFGYAPYTCNKVTRLFSSNNLTNRLLCLNLFAITFFLFFFALKVDNRPIVLG